MTTASTRAASRRLSLGAALLLLAGVALPFRRKMGERGVAVALTVLLVARVTFRLLDSRFVLPPDAFGSTFWHGWRVSPHGEVISGNGFNLWILLGRDMWSSSKEPFTALRLGAWTQNLTPYHTGIVLYAALLDAWLRLVRRFARDRSPGVPAGLVASSPPEPGETP